MRIAHPFETQYVSGMDVRLRMCLAHVLLMACCVGGQSGSERPDEICVKRPAQTQDATAIGLGFDITPQKAFSIYNKTWSATLYGNPRTKMPLVLDVEEDTKKAVRLVTYDGAWGQACDAGNQYLIAVKVYLRVGMEGSKLQAEIDGDWTITPDSEASFVGSATQAQVQGTLQPASDTLRFGPVRLVSSLVGRHVDGVSTLMGTLSWAGGSGSLATSEPIGSLTSD